jgi:hypothetical protein
MRLGYAAAAGALVLATACGGGSSAQAENVVASADTVVVYKTPTCGCCNAWVDHVRDHGFPVVTHDMSDSDVAAMKRELGVPAGRISCHTATVRGYTIEGHVPADLIRRMIDERAPIRGLAVPGMPIGSPGMEGLIKQDYDVLAFDSTGAVTVYAKR